MGTLRSTICTTDDGVRLAYEVEGPAHGPTLVFSSSLGTTRDLWKPQLPTLAKTFRVVRYDTRGHGLSDVPAGDYSIERLGRDLLSVMDLAGIERSHVCGLSIGGITGLWLGIHAPNRVSSLVLANTAARIGHIELWTERIRTAREKGLEALADAAMTRWFTAAFRAREADTVAELRATMAGTKVDGYVGCSAALRDADLRALTDRVRVPTLVIVGSHDVSTSPAEGTWISERIAGARLVELDAAHLSNVECAEEFSSAVATFLASEESGHG